MSKFTVVLFVLLLTGCGGGTNLPNSPTTQGAVTSTSSSGTKEPGSSNGTKGTGSSKDVSRDQYGKRWPLTVDQAILGCTPINGGAAYDLTVNVQGVLYALNGTAMSHEPSQGYKDIHAIWAQGQDMTPLLTDARQLCA